MQCTKQSYESFYFPGLSAQSLVYSYETCGVVEEDTFLAWAGDFTRNEYSAEQSMVCLDTLEQLKAAAQPFITWLMEAEEEGDSSEEDEEDEDEDSSEGA